MNRLYLRFYLAVLASILVLAVAAGFVWRQLAERSPLALHAEMLARQAEDLLPQSPLPAQALEPMMHQLMHRGRADLALYTPDGRLLASAGDPVPPPDLGRPGGRWLDRWRGPPVWSQALADGRFIVVRPHPPRHPPGGGLLVTLAILALAVAIGAYPVVRRLTGRLERLQTAVESLGRGDLRTRVPVEGKDEIARLANSFNDAAGRIEELMNAHRLLLANASHELRTPLARVRMGIELLAGNAPAADPARKAALEQDIAELDGLIDEILLTSRLDAAPGLDRVEPLDLLALTAEESARYADCSVSGSSVRVSGDSRLLRRMIRNLLENAQRHGRPPIEVEVGAEGGFARLQVSDAGPGIPAAEREAVFQPFHQVGGRKREGSGLGLSLVRQIARLHGGEAAVQPAPTGGATLVVTLPTESAPPQASPRSELRADPPRPA